MYEVQIRQFGLWEAADFGRWLTVDSAMSRLRKLGDSLGYAGTRIVNAKTGEVVFEGQDDERKAS